MKSTVKVQQTKSNTFINLTKDIRGIFKVAKGEVLLIENIGENEIRIKKV